MIEASTTRMWLTLWSYLLLILCLRFSHPVVSQETSLDNSDSRWTPVRLCGDEKCSVPVSMGRTLIMYNSPDEHIISFKPNTNVVIYAKTKSDLWVGEIAGKRGFIPKKFVQETKVLTAVQNLISVLPDNSKSIVEWTSTVEAGNKIADVTSSAGAAVWFPETNSQNQNNYGDNIVETVETTSLNREDVKIVTESLTDADKNIDIRSSQATQGSIDETQVSIQPTETATLKSPSLINIENSIIQSSTDIDELHKGTDVINPTPTVSTDSYVSESITKESMNLIDSLFDYVAKELIVPIRNDGKRELKAKLDVPPKKSGENEESRLDLSKVNFDAGVPVANTLDEDDSSMQVSVSNDSLVNDLMSNVSADSISVNVDDSNPKQQSDNSNPKQQSDNSNPKDHSDNSKINQQPDHSIGNRQSDNLIANQEPDDSNVKQQSDNINVSQESDDSKVNQTSDDSKVNQTSDDSKVNQTSDDSKTNQQSGSVSAPSIIGTIRPVVVLDTFDIKEQQSPIEEDPNINNLAVDMKESKLELDVKTNESSETTKIILSETKSPAVADVPVSDDTNSTINASISQISSEDNVPELNNSNSTIEASIPELNNYNSSSMTVVPESSNSEFNITVDVELNEKEKSEDISKSEHLDERHDKYEDTKEYDHSEEVSDKLSMVAPTVDEKSYFADEIQPISETEDVVSLNVTEDPFLFVTNSMEEESLIPTEIVIDNVVTVSMIGVDEVSSEDSIKSNFDLDGNTKDTIILLDESSVTSSEPLSSLLMDTTSSSEYVSVGLLHDYTAISGESPVDVSVDSCDAGIFEGNCPNALNQESSGHVEAETHESVDYLKVCKDYLLIVKEYVQVFHDYLPEPVQIYLMGVSPHVIVFTAVMGVFILTIQIAIITFKKYSKERSLMIKLCHLDGLYFAVTTERDELKEKLDTINHNMTSWKSDYVGAQDALYNSQTELELTKGDCAALRAIVANLSEQLEEATEAGLELNRMLSEFLASQNDVVQLRDAIKLLQEQLDSQSDRLSDVLHSSETMSFENQDLKCKLKNQIETNQQLNDRFQENIIKLSHAEDQVNELQKDLAIRDEKLEMLQQNNCQLLREADVWNESIKELQSRIDVYETRFKEITDSLKSKCNETETLKECVSKLQKVTQEIGTDGEVSADDVEAVWQSLLDVSTLKSELAIVVKERNEFSTKISDETEARMHAEIVSRRAVEEADVLRREFDAANQEREEAAKKLEILSNYFMEKEMQLQKELGVQEAIRQKSQDSIDSVHVKMNLFEQEVQHYKSQIASLKLEIESQERSYKTQIANQEKKAHENWLAARSAERRLEECKQEAASLRNKLIMQERIGNQSDASQVHQRTTIESDNRASPQRLAQSDRYDSNQDLPSSSRSSLYRESVDYGHTGVPFLPIDRPIPPPFIRGMPPGPPLLFPPPFDIARMGPMLPLPPPPLPPLPFDINRVPPPPEHWMPPPSPIERQGNFDGHPNQRPPHDCDQLQGHPRMFSRDMEPPLPNTKLSRQSIQPSLHSAGSYNQTRSPRSSQLTDDCKTSV